MTDLLPTGPAGAPPVSTVLICDERPVAGRELAIQLKAGLAVRVLAVRDGAGMVDAFTAAPADVILIGLRYGSDTGTLAMDMLLTPYPWATVIVYGGVPDAALLSSAVNRGARGLMIWDIGGQQHQVTRPGASNPHTPGSAHASKTAVPVPVPLTDREIQVLRGMSDGRSNIAIGRELSLSEDTIKTHARRLFNKIGAVDRAHAVALGLRMGLL